MECKTDGIVVNVKSSEGVRRLYRCTTHLEDWKDADLITTLESNWALINKSEESHSCDMLIGCEYLKGVI